MDNIGEKYFLTRGKAILFGLIVIAAIIIFIIFKINNNISINEYKYFEDELKIGATNYTEINGIYLDDGEEIKVQMDDILKVYTTDNKLKNKCVGYVTITSEKNISTEEYETIYRPYIKCGNRYVTSNYSEY